MHYRREIDGLRAVAVSAVILFHAGFSTFSGGFIGVDVFFVISGYLITGILIRDLDQGNFSLIQFYERRARRILPALFFVMLACIPFAYLWMMPSQLEDFSQSLVAVVLFLSNWLFWSQTGYFGTSAEIKPLLHTWSLAVEEQFYLIFPILLMVLWRFFRKFVFIVLSVLIILSLLLSEWGWRNEPEINFFFTFSRFWELLIGSCCALYTAKKKQYPNNIPALIGILMIISSIFMFDSNTPFPSIYTLIPVIGTSLIIIFGYAGTWVAKLLSMQVLVRIGLISYSAYLWHQPLFAFARLRSIVEPSQLTMSALAGVTFLFAWISWRWIEQPFRGNRETQLLTRRGIFAVSGLTGSIFAGVGLAGHIGKGFEWRMNDQVLNIIDSEKDIANNDCDHNFNRESYKALSHPIPECLSSINGSTNVMLIGDSHMWSLADSTRYLLGERGISYYFLSNNSCMPLVGFQIYSGQISTDCEDFIDDAFEWASQSGIETVVIAARFPLYLHGERYNNREGGVELGEPAWVDTSGRPTSNWDDNERRDRVLLAYEARIRELAVYYNIVLVSPIPEAGWNVPNQLFKNFYFSGNDDSLSTSYGVYMDRTNEIISLFNKLEKEVPSIYQARVHEVLCKEETARCINADADGIYYYDDDHLSNQGAKLVAPTIVEAIELSLGR